MIQNVIIAGNGFAGLWAAIAAWRRPLLPYSLGGVFFVVAHAFCGLRLSFA